MHGGSQYALFVIGLPLGCKCYLCSTANQEIDAVAPVWRSVDVIARDSKEGLHETQHVGDLVRVEVLKNCNFAQNVLWGVGHK